MIALGRTLRLTGLGRGMVSMGAAAAGGGALAILALHNTKIAIAAAFFVLIVGITAIKPLVIAGLAIPATLIVAAVGGSTSNISFSDFTLFFASLVALPNVRMRESSALRQLLVADLVYQAALLPTIFYNPYRADFVEWAHELMLVSGSLIVGWVVGREGYARRALSVYLFGACIIGAWSGIQALRTHLQPAFLPFNMQKNSIGIMMMYAIVIVLANPSWARWKAGVRRLVLFLCIAGLLGCQSHQAMIGSFAGAVVIYVRNRKLGRRSKLMLIGLVPLVAISYEAITREFASTNRFNSVHQRLTWYSDSLQVFHVSPWFGVGLRWWYQSRFPFSFQPPNGELEMLTSAGIVGLAAFLYLFGRMLATAWRIPLTYSTFAMALLVARLVDGQFDIFWVGATAALPILATGLALGTCSRTEQLMVPASAMRARARAVKPRSR